MRTLNLGILAHVDAGKTTLTERLLYAAGVIDEIGSVDKGNTQTDSLALERERGITIKSAVVSFVVDDVAINLIDTPGHPDFIAEVERVLDVLDGVVLVISAVEGVQAQTRVLMRALRRLRLPTLFFVNKIDRAGARSDELTRDIAEKLDAVVVPMGSVRALGTLAAQFVPYDATSPDVVSDLAERLGSNDESILGAYLENETAVSYRRMRKQLAAQTKRAVAHPVFLGSAKTGAGVDALTAGITTLLPAAEADADGTASGVVFKVDRGDAGERIAYVRMFAGTLRTRDHLEDGQKVTAISVFDRGSAVPRPAVVAGEIGKLWGVNRARIGDRIGASGAAPGHRFAPPTLETVIVPVRAEEKVALHNALTQLAEQDPLINLRQDDIRQELSVSLYGEVQKEVVQATLATDFGIDVEFRETTTICIERPGGTGEAVELKGTPSNPFPLGAVGLRIEPGPVGSGVVYRRAGEVLGRMPRAFFTAVEETVHGTLQQGICGWQVVDCVVTLTHAGYTARHSHAHQKFNKSMSSTAGDFRSLTPLVVMDALKRAGTMVCEPILRFVLEIPDDVLGAVVPALARLHAVALTQRSRGSWSILEGHVPAAYVHEVQLRLRALTRGEGVLEATFDRYEPVRGPSPTRPRTDHNPLNRKEYLLRVLHGRGAAAR